MRRHLDKLARDFQIHLLHLLKIGQILVKQLGDLDIAYFDLIFGEQHQYEVERAGKILQLVARMHDAFQMIARFLDHGYTVCLYTKCVTSRKPNSAKTRSLSKSQDVAVESGPPRIFVETSTRSNIMP